MLVGLGHLARLRRRGAHAPGLQRARGRERADRHRRMRLRLAGRAAWCCRGLFDQQGRRRRDGWLVPVRRPAAAKPSSPTTRRPARGTVGAVAGPSLADPAKNLALADYPGKVVVLNVWGSWCGPCRTEAPDLQFVATQSRWPCSASTCATTPRPPATHALRGHLLRLDLRLPRPQPRGPRRGAAQRRAAHRGAGQAAPGRVRVAGAGAGGQARAPGAAPGDRVVPRTPCGAHAHCRHMCAGPTRCA